MSNLNVFDFITLNGFYKDAQNNFGWHRHGEEEKGFSMEGLGGKGMLVFGRITYELMYSSWTSEALMKSMPDVANGMNSAEKVVFSNTLKKADWNNTTLVKGDAVAEMKKLKQTAKKDMTILGSGKLVAGLADEGLIDTYQIMIDPVALGGGTTLFGGMKNKLDLKLTGTRVFKSGCVLLSYEKLK